jgi:hypothetical protein
VADLGRLLALYLAEGASGRRYNRRTVCAAPNLIRSRPARSAAEDGTALLAESRVLEEGWPTGCGRDHSELLAVQANTGPSQRQRSPSLPARHAHLGGELCGVRSGPLRMDKTRIGNLIITVRARRIPGGVKIGGIPFAALRVKAEKSRKGSPRRGRLHVVGHVGAGDLAQLVDHPIGGQLGALGPLWPWPSRSPRRHEVFSSLRQPWWQVGTNSRLVETKRLMQSAGKIRAIFVHLPHSKGRRLPRVNKRECRTQT